MTTPYLAAFVILDEHTIEPCHFEPVDAPSCDETVEAAAEVAALVARGRCFATPAPYFHLHLIGGGTWQLWIVTKRSRPCIMQRLCWAT